MLESLLSAFNHTQNFPVELWTSKISNQQALTIIFFSLVLLIGMALKLEKVGANFFFSPKSQSISIQCPSLPSVATDDRKQFHCLNIVLNN